MAERFRLSVAYNSIKETMIRKLLFLASFPLMAAPLISWVASPAIAASLYGGEQRGTSKLNPASFESNSVLISGWYDRDRNDDRDRRREELRRNIRQNARELRDLQRRDSNRYYPNRYNLNQDRFRDRDYRYRNDNPYYPSRNYNPHYPYRNYNGGYVVPTR